MGEIPTHCHSLECGGHFNGQRTVAKVVQSGFYGLLYSKMHTHLQSPVIDVKGPGTLDDKMKCH